MAGVSKCLISISVCSLLTFTCRAVPYSFFPTFQSQQPTPSSANAAIFDLVKQLPMSFYNNYICNTLVSVSYHTGYSYRSPYHYYLYFNRGKRSSISAIIRGVYQGLLPYWDTTEANQLLQDVAQVTLRLAADPYNVYSAADILKEVLREKLESTQEKGSVDDIYQIMRSLKTIGANELRKCTSGLLQQSCGSIRGQLYCNYVKQLSTAPVCSSAYFSTQLWDRCCNVPTPSIPQSPYPLPATTPTTTTTITPTTTTTATTTTTTPTTTTITTTPTPVKACGISTKNPASKYADFANTLRQFRIVGGANAEVCEYPWMVRLQMGNNLCGGTIIDETHVMTAGHCIGSLKPEDMTAYVGEYNYNIQESQDQQVGVAAVNLHPDYREVPPDAAENDIAILTLDRPLTYSDCVQPICLAQPGDSASLDNAQCTTIGWGRTSYNGNPSPILQKVTMPTYSGALCDAQFPNTTPTNPNIQICAGRPAGGADSCQGDSGGPLFCPVDGKYVQYGIVSYGDNCAVSGNAGVYTDVGEMTNFINSVL